MSEKLTQKEYRQALAFHRERYVSQGQDLETATKMATVLLEGLGPEGEGGLEESWQGYFEDRGLSPEDAQRAGEIAASTPLREIER